MKKVRVYWNLHKKVWSVQDVKSGRVVAHRQFITIRDAKFVVRKGGQKRVRQEGKKNVHAFAVGYIQDWRTEPSHMVYLDDWDRVKYNPYTDDYFMHQGMSDNQYKPKEWNYIPKDWVGIINMDSTEGGNPKVYI